MGWKSTIDITRREAEDLAKKQLLEMILKVDDMEDMELEDYLEELGYGDDPDLEYYGHNFAIDR